MNKYALYHKITLKILHEECNNHACGTTIDMICRLFNKKEYDYNLEYAELYPIVREIFQNLPSERFESTYFRIYGKPPSNLEMNELRLLALSFIAEHFRLKANRKSGIV